MGVQPLEHVIIDSPIQRLPSPPSAFLSNRHFAWYTNSSQIPKARQQVAKQPCRPKLSRSPVVAARQSSTSVVLLSSLSSSTSFASSISLFQELRTPSLKTTRPRTGSRIPLLTRRLVSSRPLRSCLKAPRDVTLGPSSKRVHFGHPFMTKADLRFLEYDEPTGTCPISEVSKTIIPHKPGRSFISLTRIPLLSGTTLGPQYTHTRYNGIFLEPSRAGLKGPDGQFRRCPYCMSNASVGGWVPPFPGNLETISEDYSSHWWLEAQELNCEEHE